MKLIGMLDSPFVRRVAVTAKLLGIPFELEQISVLRQFQDFQRYNPLVKAPTLITDDGTILMESSLIIELLEKMACDGNTLMPDNLDEYIRAQRIIGLALIACEKTVQIVYEYNLRPEEKRHDVWLARVNGQLADAFSALNAELEGAAPWVFGDVLTQADVTAAIAWRFTQFNYPELTDAAAYPAIAALSARAEALPAFASTPLD